MTYDQHSLITERKQQSHNPQSMDTSGIKTKLTGFHVISCASLMENEKKNIIRRWRSLNVSNKTKIIQKRHRPLSFSASIYSFLGKH